MHSLSLKIHIDSIDLMQGKLFQKCTDLLYCSVLSLSPKFKRVLLNETPKFPFWGLNICVDFDLRGSKKNGKYEEN